ncbi:MAG: efflux RND transporter permease subunit, partial [Myxococcales bacterium]|nr:efflux RND transporter permease subunit [Myxococcales bacterium]
MGGLIGTAIRRPVSVLSAVILLVMFGLMSLVGIPIQLTPDIEVPTLTVQTNWPGAAPAEVERELLVPQEEVLKSVQGLRKMTAEARRDQGTITLELEVGSDLDEALVRVTNRLAQVPRYPDAADQPVVSTADAAGPPLAVVLLRAKDGSAVAAYRTWFEDEGLPRLERIKGVAKIDFFGGRDTEVHVDFDPEALAARGIPVSRLAAAVRAELTDISGGDVTLGKRSFVVRTMAAPVAYDDLEKVVVATGPDGEPVRIGDVARVRQGLRERTAYVFNNEREAMALLFRREAGSNVLEVTEEILAEVDAVQVELLDPLGLELAVVNDQSGYIYAALDLVRSNLVVGGLLAGVVLLAFLRSVRASAVVAVAIPVSVVGTALGMSLLGRTVNIVSLAGMAFAVGMVVDNAIVVMEAIDTWRGRTASIEEAALEGTREVWGALVASTLTTVAVFFPIALWQDTVGELLRDVAVAVSCAVSISLVVSVLVIPSFAAVVVKHGSAGDGGPGRFARAVGAVGGWFARGLVRAGCLSVAVVAVTSLLAFLLTPPMEYLPTGNRNLLFGILVPPPGYSVDEVIDVGQRFQDGLVPHIGRDADGVPSIERTFFVARSGQVFMGASATDPGRIGDLVGFYRARQRGIPGMFGVASQASLFGRGVGASRAVDVQIGGADLQELVGVGGKLMGMLNQALPGAQIRPIPSLDLGAPELQVLPRRVDGARLGMSGAELGETVDALVDGRIIGELGREGQPNLRVVVGAKDGGVLDPSALLGTSVATPRGEVVPMAALATVRETTGPTTIQRIERRRAITLQVSPPEDLALEEAMRRIREEVLPQAGLPSTVRVTLAGTADDLTVAKEKLGQVLLL